MQTVEAKVKNNQQSKSKKMVAKWRAEVWQQLLGDNGDMRRWQRQWRHGDSNGKGDGCGCSGCSGGQGNGGGR
jgi:hypothetical protein